MALDNADPGEAHERRYQVRIHSACVREFKKLPAAIQKLVRERLAGLQTEPRPPGCKKLGGVPRGTPPLFRIRIRDHRVVYAALDPEVLVLVLGVRDRKQVSQALRTYLDRLK